MAYVKEALKRASIQSLREYLLYGVSEEEYSAKSYEMRLKKAFQMWREMADKYEKEVESSELDYVFRKVLEEHEHVYMELGIQAGFRLAKEINRNEEGEGLYSKYKDMYTSLFEDATTAIKGLQKAQKNAEEIYLAE